MKYSRQREAILESVRKSCNHPNADMVYEDVRKEIPNVSLGTVYRNLNHLAQLGDIRRIIMPNGSDRFDKTLENHYHMYCQKCNELIDIKSSQLSKLNQSLSLETGHEIISHDIVFLGTCKCCLSK